MIKKTIVFLFIISGLLIISIPIIDFSEGDDILFYNGTIITMEKNNPSPEAVYIENGIIKSIGEYGVLSQYVSSSTKLIDLKGQTLLPGFIDSHTHPVLCSFVYDAIDLSGFKHNSKEKLWEYFSGRVKTYKPGEWILCKGFDQILTKNLTPPHIDFLDSIAPNNPVLIASHNLHSYWANSLAFQESGVSKATLDPSLTSYYERDGLGNFTGYIVEQDAFEPFKKKILVALGISKLKQSSVRAMKEYTKNGYTSITSLGITTSDPRVIQLYKHISSKTSSLFNHVLQFFNLLPKRNHTARHFVFVRYDALELLPNSSLNGDDFFKILGIKLWYDGSPYAGSMYINDPYLENNFTKNILNIPSQHSGLALLTKSELNFYINTYQSKGWQIAIHAQGDQAIKEILNSFEDVGNQLKNDYRHRLEHCLLIEQPSIKKMSKLNIHPSFHINYLYYYGSSLKQQVLGSARAGRILPLKLANDHSLKYTLHSDQPMFPGKPFSLLQTAVSRETKEGNILGEQYSISTYEALEALTVNAAWQIKMDEKIGSIKEGKYADLIILNTNPLESNTEDLKNIKVLKTFVHGNQINY